MLDFPDYSGFILALVILAVFGVWKLIDAIVWLFNHVQIV